MKLLLGLGNRGEIYEGTRHNTGWVALDFFRQNSDGFSEWQNSEKFQAEISEGEIDGQKIILAKPQSFMNLSGQASRRLKDFYKIEIPDIIVLHDDLDLTLGVLRLAQNSGSAGHKGVQSIIASLGSQNFCRVRIGIKPARTSFFSFFFKTPAEKFVLQKFSESEKKEMQKIIEKTNNALLLILKEGFLKAQMKFN